MEDVKLQKELVDGYYKVRFVGSEEFEIMYYSNNSFKFHKHSNQLYDISCIVEYKPFTNEEKQLIEDYFYKRALRYCNFFKYIRAIFSKKNIF